ncbi:MAG TPA: ribonuclease P protein component [Roseivirga sp.]
MTEIAKPTLRFTFPKSERLHSKKLIEELFNKGSYFYLYPFRVTFLPLTPTETTQVLFSVSKKKFKSAVTRNKIKRKLKEAYRLNKTILDGSAYHVAFIYTSDELSEFSFAEKRIKKALQKLKELNQNLK